MLGLGDMEVELGWFLFTQVFIDLLGTRQRRRSGAGAESETETGSGSVTVTGTEIAIENETAIETTSGETGPALGRGIKGSLDTGPGAEVRVPPKSGRTETSTGRGTWTDGGISTWTALPRKSPLSGTFTMAKLPASCSLDALCS